MPETLAEVPSTCPACGADLESPYHQLAPSRAARTLRKAAVALLPVMVAIYAVLLLWGRFPRGFGTGLGYFAIGWIAAPSLLLHAVSLLFPEVRRVICLRCSWNQEFPSRKTTLHRI